MEIERAMVIGASGGIGGAVADRLERNGAEVTRLSRKVDGLDVTDESTVERLLGQFSPGYDLVFVATGGLGRPEKMLRALEAGQMAAQFALNAMGPALVLKHALALMPRDRRAVFAALSARVGSIGDNGLGGWYSYRASKAALNQLIHTAAIEVARTHPQAVVALLHPGTVATSFTEGFTADKLSPDEAARRLLAVLDGLGPDESGQFFDHAGKAVAW